MLQISPTLMLLFLCFAISALALSAAVCALLLLQLAARLVYASESDAARIAEVRCKSCHCFCSASWPSAGRSSLRKWCWVVVVLVDCVWGFLWWSILCWRFNGLVYTLSVTNPFSSRLFFSSRDFIFRYISSSSIRYSSISTLQQIAP